jgi:uncharacterized protein DUF4154
MAFLTSARARRAAAQAAALLMLCAALHAQAPVAGEKTVKAAFLYNFTKFVAWPPSAFEGTSRAFTVCVFADPAFGRDIEDMLAGETVAGRPLRVVRPEGEDARGCHMAYFAGADAERALRAVRQAPVLTVGEGTRFLEQGGLISFVLEDNRVRFDVNKRAVDSAGLTISSKLLRVARNVDTGGAR